jgi:stalled ribosome rescue protein Dom34
MSNVGIWIDRSQAIIVSVDSDLNTEVQKIDSGIEGRVRIDGEGKDYTRMGNQFADNERTKEEKLKHNLKDYFGRVIDAVSTADSIVIIGPAEAKTDLHKQIQSVPNVASKVAKVEPADSMTDNQVVALIKTYFK